MEIILNIFEYLGRKDWCHARQASRILWKVLDYNDSHVRKLFLAPVWRDYKRLSLENFAHRVRLVEATKAMQFRIFSDKLLWKYSAFENLFNCVNTIERLQKTRDPMFPKEVSMPVISMVASDLQLSNCRRVFPKPFMPYQPIFITASSTSRTLMLIPELTEARPPYEEAHTLCSLVTYDWKTGFPANAKRTERTTVHNNKIIITGFRIATDMWLDRNNYQTLGQCPFAESTDWIYADQVLVKNMTSMRTLRKINNKDLKEMPNVKTYHFPGDLPHKLTTLPEPVPTLRSERGIEEDTEIITIDE